MSCIDFRYITDVLTEEDALGEFRSFLGYTDVHAQEWDALLPKRVSDAFYFFQKYCRQVKLVKKKEVGCKNIFFIVFANIAHFLSAPVLWGYTLSSQMPHAEQLGLQINVQVCMVKPPGYDL